MRKIENEWPADPSYEGVLFFAQCIDEMLFDYSSDSYRAPAMNTYFRIQEAISVIVDVKSKKLNEKIAQPAIEEVMWSIKNDLAFKETFLHESDFICDELNKFKEKPTEALKLLAYVFRLSSNGYLNTLLEILTELVGDPKKKETLYKAAQATCSHLVNMGYHRRYVYFISNKIFFADKITKNPNDLLKSFFDCFPIKKKPYHVFVKISDQAANYVEKTKFYKTEKLTKDKLPKHVKSSKLFRSIKEKQSILKLSIDDFYEEHTAREAAESAIYTARSFAATVGAARNFTWENRMLVEDANTKAVCELDSGVDVLDRRLQMPFKKRMGKFQERTGIILRQDLLPESRERIVRALRSFSSAFTARSNEMKLISLWSAMEVLLPNPDSGPRIKTYIDYAVPCVTRKYSFLNFMWSYTDLSRIYRDELSEILDKVDEDVEPHEKFILACSLDKYRSNVLNDIFSLCEGNPLARNRVYRLAIDHETIGAHKKFLASHAMKVEWQIHRIYRTRNSIVHTGDRLPYLESILLNLHEYFVRVLSEIERMSIQNNYMKRLDTFFNDIVIDDGIHKKYISSLGDTHRFSKETIFRVVRATE